MTDSDTTAAVVEFEFSGETKTIDMARLLMALAGVGYVHVTTRYGHLVVRKAARDEEQ